MSFENRRAKNNSKNYRERGAAMAIAVIVLTILAVIAMTALAFSSTEARIAGSDLQRTHAFYAAAAGMEKMTNDFSNLFLRKLNPTRKDLDEIQLASPEPLKKEGFVFTQTIEEDTDRLNKLRATQGLPNTIYPRVNIPDGPYAGLYASIVPYKMTSTATQKYSKAEVELEREFNNYLVPLFQFGMFSNEDIEVHPGPPLTFNGRVHTNQNLYALRNTKFLNKVTIAGELVRDAWRSGESNTSSGNSEVFFEVNGVNVRSELTKGSVKSGSGKVGGPNLTGSPPECVDPNLNCPGRFLRGFFPGSPEGVANSAWDTESVKTPNAGTPESSTRNRFGGQVLTKSTGSTALKLPLETGGNNAAELIKRALPSDGEMLASSRYHNKSEIRILIDDETAGSGAANVAGIGNKGVLLSEFLPSVLNGGSNVLKIISDAGTISGSTIRQKTSNGSTTDATTVRAVRNDTAGSNPYVPPGSGVTGRILIEIVKPDGTTIDVTQTILSMGVTEGEPNGIIYLQRPLWAAFVQGSRDRQGTNNFNLVNLTRNSQIIADGEIVPPTSFANNRGYISMTAAAADEDKGMFTREYAPISDPAIKIPYNKIVPINIYNVREGWMRSSLSEFDIHERGMMSVVEINMRNLARWLDGIYDNNLLAGTKAVSTNIRDEEGYVVYISDRRGDKADTEYLKDGTAFQSTNGIVDNEDIYGPNGVLDPGEDVIDFGWSLGGKSKKGTLQKKVGALAEIVDSGTLGITPAKTATINDRLARGNTVLNTPITKFRRSVRLFDGETLSFTAAANKLSPIKGITISSENMVYIWGNYNTTGITGIPTGGSTLNNGGYTGAQIPSSIVCDAFSPLSKTWFDALSILYPEGSSDPRKLQGEPYRAADENLPSTLESTSMRAGIIAGTTVSAMNGTPGKDANGQRRNGGIINYPRFLEMWNYVSGNVGIERSWNYSGSFVPLFRSTQALAQWENDTAVTYMPPRRNWSFDETFLTPQKLPPGTPFFQYVQATGFRQSLY